jgi:hypothetical protein
MTVERIYPVRHRLYGRGVGTLRVTIARARWVHIGYRNGKPLLRAVWEGVA